LRCKEVALLAGRAWQSDETRFVHYCYHSDSKDTIPTRENFCFALALLRSRAADNIQEAKELLERLLSYQVEGNFPIYLHEYPTCYDRWRAAEILPSMIWIIRGFHHVLGKSLKGKIEKSIRETVVHCLANLEDRTVEDIMSLRVGCSTLAAGRYFEDQEWVQKGAEVVEKISTKEAVPSWFISEKLGHQLASLNLIDIDPRLWNHCRGLYHETLGVYCGPHLSERQWGIYPEPNLFNLYMGDKHSCEELCPAYLLGALIHPTDKQQGGQSQFSDSLEGRHWEVIRSDDWSVSLIEQNDVLTPVENKTFSPVYMIWESEKELQSLVAQGGNVVQSRFDRTDHEIVWTFVLGPEADNDHPKDRVELVFFCTRGENRVTVDDKRATVFKLGEKVNIESEICSSLEFTLEKGEGDFTGHLSFGNRLSQIDSRGEALDWKIALRSVRRSAECVIKVKLSIDA